MCPLAPITLFLTMVYSVPAVATVVMFCLNCGYARIGLVIMIGMIFAAWLECLAWSLLWGLDMLRQFIVAKKAKDSAEVEEIKDAFSDNIGFLLLFSWLGAGVVAIVGWIALPAIIFCPVLDSLWNFAENLFAKRFSRQKV